MLRTMMRLKDVVEGCDYFQTMGSWCCASAREPQLLMKCNVAICSGTGGSNTKHDPILYLDDFSWPYKLNGTIRRHYHPDRHDP